LVKRKEGRKEVGTGQNARRKLNAPCPSITALRMTRSDFWAHGERAWNPRQDEGRTKGDH